MSLRLEPLEAFTNSADSTRALAAAVSELARPCDLILVVGDLGAGKTAFVQGFAKGLGIEDRVTSPTFALIQSYEGRLRMHHLDVYRLIDTGETGDLGLAELLDDDAVTLIEWGDTITSVLPGQYLEIRLAPVEADVDDARVVRLSAVGPAWQPRVTALEVALEPWVETGGPSC